MSLLQTLSFIARHPLNRAHPVAALARFAKCQVGSRLVPRAVVFNWVNGARFIVRRGEPGLTGNVYCGLHEFADMAYVLHVLRPDDLFVDIGANVGSYTVLACAAKKARGVCVEPVPSTFKRLQDNLAVNDLFQRVEALNVGLGDQPGELEFTSGSNCTNHVVSNGDGGLPTVKVEVMTLDEALNDRAPSLIKIDVEGFELPVLRGASATLANPRLTSITMELNGSGARYGYDEGEILQLMRSHGFTPYSYEPYTRQLVPCEGKNVSSGNTIFIRDKEFIGARLAGAEKILVNGVWL